MIDLSNMIEDEDVWTYAFFAAKAAEKVMLALSDNNITEWKMRSLLSMLAEKTLPDNIKVPCVYEYIPHSLLEKGSDLEFQYHRVRVADKSILVLKSHLNSEALMKKVPDILREYGY